MLMENTVWAHTFTSLLVTSLCVSATTTVHYTAIKAAKAAAETERWI